MSSVVDVCAIVVTIGSQVMGSVDCAIADLHES